jgi:hypothetical protein
MKHLLSLVLCVAALVIAAPTVFGQTGPIGTGTGPKAQTVQTPGTFAGSTWSGSENLGGFGKLTFVFKDAKKAIMVDAKSTVEGSYEVKGQNITIRFGNCVYNGTINGNVLSGTAQYTSQNSPTWAWNVAMQGSAAPSMPAMPSGPTGPTGPIGNGQ